MGGQWELVFWVSFPPTLGATSLRVVGLPSLAEHGREGSTGQGQLDPRAWEWAVRSECSNNSTSCSSPQIPGQRGLGASILPEEGQG